MKGAGGNCSSDGRGGYSCSNVDPARYQQAANCGGGCGVTPAPPSTTPPGGGTIPADPIAGTLAPTVGILSGGNSNCQKVQFTYFYINGINTPSGPDVPAKPGQWRGNYQSEHDSVALNLIDVPKIPRPSGKPQNIKVANETDAMYGATHNPSGTDTWAGAQWIADNCPGKNVVWNVPECLMMEAIGNFRAGNFTGHMAPGDLFECIRQSVNVPNFVPGADLRATANDATVQQVVQAILGIYQQEQAGSQTSQTKNYFIVVGHSQGNFFIEGVAYALGINNAGGVGQKIYQERLGLVSLASPTSFERFDASFRSAKIVHHTRADDAINIVGTVQAGLAGVGISGKKPWPPNDPMLWPWPKLRQMGLDIRAAWRASGTQVPQSLFAWDQLIDPSTGVFNPLDGMFCRRLSYDSGVSLNPELYIPLMNSHLLDNYMDDPPATKPGTLMKYNPNLVPWWFAPSTSGVLNCIRRDLLQLKTNLMTGSNQPATTNCSSSSGN